MSVVIAFILNLFVTTQAVQLRASLTPDVSHNARRHRAHPHQHQSALAKASREWIGNIPRAGEEHEVAHTQKKCHPRPKGLFCFSLVRTPPEPTAVLLAKQLSAGCDGWALFGDTEDPVNNITKAWAKESWPNAFANQFREVFTEGVWKHLFASGALDQYEWFLNVEPDTFVRSSTLRKVSTRLHTSCESGFHSVADNYIDGWFMMWQADFVVRMKSMDFPRSCDAILSGHDRGEDFAHKETCLRMFNIPEDSQGNSLFETLKDPQGNALVAMPQSHANDVGIKGPKECEDIVSLLLKQSGLNIKTPICECTFNEQPRPSCLSLDFVSVHPVKNALTYSQLMGAFP